MDTSPPVRSSGRLKGKQKIRRNTRKHLRTAGAKNVTARRNGKGRAKKNA